MIEEQGNNQKEGTDKKEEVQQSQPEHVQPDDSTPVEATQPESETPEPPKEEAPKAKADAAEEAGATEENAVEVSEGEADAEPATQTEAVEQVVAETKEAALAPGSEPAEETSDEVVAATAGTSADEEDDFSDAESSADHEEHDEEEENQEEDEDYTRFSLEELLDISRKITQEKALNAADRSLRLIRLEVDRISDEMEGEAKTKYVSETGSDEGFHFDQPKQAKDFYEILKKHRQLRKESFENQRKEREQNLAKKQAILSELKDIVESPEQSGSYAKVKEIRDKWKGIGSVPKLEAEDLYRSFDALMKRFYDNKSIENDLKDLDRKKNLKIKEELCEKAEGLLEQENVNEAVKVLKKLHEEYKEAGPVPREVSEDVWQRFKKASDALYDKKRAFSEEYKKQLQENMKVKQELCLQLEEFINFDSDRIKEWNAKTKDLLKLQEAWEQTGPLPKEVAKDINRQFWKNFKQFFANKSAFFEKLEAARKENLTKKEALCEEADALKDSTDWKATASKLKKLQADWREIGPVPEAQRVSIYNRFKSSCDEFFNRMRNRHNQKEKEFEDNLGKKKEVCKKIETLSQSDPGNFEELDKLKKEYDDIGYVPRNSINAILEEYVTAIEKFIESVPGKSDEEKEKLKLKEHVKLSESQPNLVNKLNKQEQGIRKKISKIEADISLWENNLQFFASSKTADKLKKDFSQKIDKAKEELVELQKQLKMINKISN